MARLSRARPPLDGLVDVLLNAKAAPSLLNSTPLTAFASFFSTV
jgi:hypothetical protein